MKKWYFFSSIILICLVSACNNSGQSNSTIDSSVMPAPTDNTRMQDTGNGRMGDTASYNRMQQKTGDSLEK